MDNEIDEFRAELRINIKNRSFSKEMLYQIEKSKSPLEVAKVLNKYFDGDYGIIPKDLKRFFDLNTLKANNIFIADKNYKKVEGGIEKIIGLNDSELDLSLQGNGSINLSMYDNSKAAINVRGEAKIKASLKHYSYADINVSENSSIEILLHDHASIHLSSFGKSNVFIQALDTSKVGASCLGSLQFIIEGSGESYSVVRNDGKCHIQYYILENEYDRPVGGCPIIKDLNNNVLYTSKFWKVEQVKKLRNHH